MCYINDDDSSDNTINIVNEYVLNYPDKFILLNLDNKKHGANYNFMSLIRYAKDNLNEKYYFFCDQDDVWLNDKIKREVNKLKDIDDEITPSLVYCDQKFVDSKLNIFTETNEDYFNITRAKPTFENLSFSNFIPGCTICANKKTIEIVAGLDENKIVMFDWASVIVASTKENGIAYIKEPLMLYRQHGNNAVGIGGSMNRPKIISLVLSKLKKPGKNSFELCEELKTQLREIALNLKNNKKIDEWICIEKLPKIYRMFLYLKHKYRIRPISLWPFL